MSRAPHKPTSESRAQVQALCGYGITEDEIASYIGIAPKTLRKHYRNELDTAVVKANALVARSLHGQATSGNVAAAIFWLKVRAGWRERLDMNHTINDAIDADEVDSRITRAIAAASAALGTGEPDA
jgi:predicted transcriptional regulator